MALNLVGIGQPLPLQILLQSDSLHVDLSRTCVIKLSVSVSVSVASFHVHDGLFVVILNSEVILTQYSD